MPKETKPGSRDYVQRSRMICERIAAGKSLEAISAEEGMPQVRTVRRWLLVSAHFRRLYARAKRLQAERLVEQVVEIADGLEAGAGDVEARRLRLRIDARKWAVAQLSADPFGDVNESDFGDVPPRFVA